MDYLKATPRDFYKEMQNLKRLANELAISRNKLEKMATLSEILNDNPDCYGGITYAYPLMVEISGVSISDIYKEVRVFLVGEKIPNGHEFVTSNDFYEPNSFRQIKNEYAKGQVEYMLISSQEEADSLGFGKEFAEAEFLEKDKESKNV